MVGVTVEKVIKIYDDGFAYGVRTDLETEGGALEIFYEEADVELKSICVTMEAVPALIAALEEFL